MRAQQSGVEFYVFQDTHKIAGFAPIKAKGWSGGVTQNSEEFLQPVHRMRNMGLMVL